MDATKCRDRWGTKTYDAFQRNAENVYTEEDKAGALGYKFPGTKFDGGIGASDPIPPEPDEDPDDGDGDEDPDA